MSHYGNNTLIPLKNKSLNILKHNLNVKNSSTKDNMFGTSTVQITK